MPKEKNKPILINGESLKLQHLPLIAEGAPLDMPSSIKKQINKSYQYLKKIAAQPEPIYGVNTGFGFSANRQIPLKDLEKLQLNLIKSHASGYGTPLSLGETRVAMTLRLNVLTQGFTGVRYELCKALLNLIEAEIYPLIPECGSVGASGDLAPLAHLALPLVGLGNVNYKGSIITAKEALKSAHLKPFKLTLKEGLGLINGTQIMLSVGGLALAKALEYIHKAEKVSALTFEALKGNPNVFNPLIHTVRPHKGQRETAKRMLKELEGSYLFDKKTLRKRVQDPYSLRCIPQVHGTSLEAIEYAANVVNVELLSATDNPLIFADQKQILSGGNFHGQPLAFAFDIASMALSELCSISERRLELLLNPNMSGLSAFLSPDEGLHSGYMAAQYLSASLVNENKLLANPSCTDSIPGNVGIEDHVSMGMTSARKLKRIVQNAKAVLSTELVVASQAVDLAKIKVLGIGTSKTYNSLRLKVPCLRADRIISDDIAKSAEVFEYL